jgi:hypothetical protein
VIEIYPAVADHYRTMVRDLRTTLAERSSEQKQEVVASVRALVEKIVIYPTTIRKAATLNSWASLRRCLVRANFAIV